MPCERHTWGVIFLKHVMRFWDHEPTLGNLQGPFPPVGHSKR